MKLTSGNANLKWTMMINSYLFCYQFYSSIHLCLMVFIQVVNRFTVNCQSNVYQLKQIQLLGIEELIFLLRYVGSRKISTWKTLTRKILTHQTQNIVRGPVSHLTLPSINNKLQFFNTTYNYRLSFTVNKSVLFSFFNFLTWHEVITYIGETKLQAKLIENVIYLITWLYRQKVSGRS